MSEHVLAREVFVFHRHFSISKTKMHTQLRDAKKYVKGNRMTRFYSFSYLLKLSLSVCHSCIEYVETLPSFSTVDVAAL